VSRYSVVHSTHISQKIGDVQRHSNEIWKFEMWGLKNECDHSPLMLASFNIPENVYMIIRWVIDYRHHHSDLRRLGADSLLKSNIEKIKNSQSEAVVHSHIFKCAEMPLSNQLLANVQIFEKECVQRYLRSIEREKRVEIGSPFEKVEKKLSSCAARVEPMTCCLQTRGNVETTR